MSNLTPETFLESFREIHEARRGVEEAKLVLADANKRAEDRGVDLASLKMLAELMKLEPDEAEKRLRTAIEYGSWAQLPINADLAQALLKTGEMPSKKAAEEHQSWAAKEAGYATGMAGDPDFNNPFNAGSEQFAIWHQGWLDGRKAQRARYNRLGQSPAKAARATNGGGAHP